MIEETTQDASASVEAESSQAASHTAGRWRVESDTSKEPRLAVVTDFSVEIAAVFDTPDSTTLSHKGEAEANARLIAAAPDLLAAAQRVLAGLNARIDDAGYKCQPVPLYDGIAELHNAIAKASGAEA